MHLSAPGENNLSTDVSLSETQKQDEIARLHAERLLGMGSWILDLQSFRLSWSPGLHALFGTDPLFFKPDLHQHFSRIHPSDRESVRRRLEQVLHSGGAQEFNYRILGGDVTRSVHSKIEVLRDEKGVLQYAIGSVQEIKKEQPVSAQGRYLISPQEDLYRNVIENISCGICITDAEGLILFGNTSMCKFSGCSMEEITGRSFAERFIPAKQRQSVLHALKEGKKLDVRIRPGAGCPGKVQARAHIIPLYNGEQEISGYAITVTEEAYHSKNRTAKGSSQLKEKFLANITHEIRTPMNGITGLTDVLLKTDLDERQRRFLEALRSSADALMVVINDIIDISRIEAGKMTFDDSPLDISLTCSTVLRLFEARAGEKKLELRKHIGPLPPALSGDHRRLSQVLINLLSNALQYTEKGTVTLNVRLLSESDTSATVEFRVIDTGAGIEKEKIPGLFRDLSHGRDEKEKNALGLSIAKRLVELQGGRMEVQSEPGVGSTFIFRVPFKKIEGGASLHADKKPGRLEGLRILVVEDDPVNQLLAEQVLNGWKCSVDMAVNGKIALEKVGLNDYDIVLMDIRMPVMDGYEATHRIRTQLRGQRSQVPILALTAHAALWESEKCLAIGMNGYLSKPYRLEDLYDEIIRLAGK